MTTKRTRKTDAHVASVTISIPIDAMDVSSITAARDAIAGLAAHLPPGSAVRVLSSRFGRVEMVMPTPADLLARLAPREQEYGVGPIVDTMAEIKQALQPEPEIPESLCRVPRQVGNGTPMDPSGDGSFRGPDAA